MPEEGNALNRDPSKYCPYCGVFIGFIHSPSCVHYRAPVEIPTSPNIATPIPPEVKDYRTEIARFVEAMVYKLGVHSKKGKWENLPMPRALDLLDGEVKELREAIERGNMVEVLLEAADVANYALIISAKALEK